VVRAPQHLFVCLPIAGQEEKTKLTAVHKKLHPRFKIHFTPDYKKDPKTGTSYDFYNKPFGLLHWMESSEGPPKDSIVALLDPDFIFLRPLTYKIKQDNVLFSPTITEDDLFDEVQLFLCLGLKW